MKIIFLYLLTTIILLPTIVFAQVTDNSKVEAQNNLDNINKTVDTLLPSQSDLFDNSKKLDKNKDGVVDEDEQIRLFKGDLEQELAPKIVKFGISISGLAITIFFTYAGVKLLLSRGNEEELTKTKDMIIQALIGTCVILGSFALIVGVIRIFNSI